MVYENFHTIAAPIIEHEVFNQSRQHIQHGEVSVYEHSVSVAYLAYKMARALKIKDMSCLVRSALLHDFFLYDWHDEWNLTHGFTHPAVAAENAKKYFAITEKEYSCIRTHMWPFTLLHIPRHIEAWIICIADKICSLKETIFLRKGQH